MMADQHRQVVSALAKRRQLNHADADAVEKIGAKLPFIRPLFQVAMRRGNQPNVGADGLFATDACEFLLLQDAEHLGLDRQGHIADFVQEERTAIALLKFADTATVGPSECAFLMSE